MFLLLFLWLLFVDGGCVVFYDSMIVLKLYEIYVKVSEQLPPVRVCVRFRLRVNVVGGGGNFSQGQLS